MSRSHGVVDEDLQALVDGELAHFGDAERVVIEYATEMTQTRVDVGDELFARMRRHYGEPQIVEITAAIAWENYRARFNHALGFESEGFAEGEVCLLPAPAAARSLPEAAGG